MPYVYNRFRKVDYLRMSETLLILVPISLMIVGLAVWLFFRMADSGQFDDMAGPAERIIQDDDRSQNRD